MGKRYTYLRAISTDSHHLFEERKLSDSWHGTQWKVEAASRIRSSESPVVYTIRQEDEAKSIQNHLLRVGHSACVNTSTEENSVRRMDGRANA